MKPGPSPACRPQIRRWRSAWALVIAYGVLLVYGTLYPLSGWDWHRGGLGVLTASFHLKHLSRSDLVTNLVVYIPLGLLAMRAWRAPTGATARIAVITLCGLALSLAMEYAQSYLPSRVSSLVDVALNGMGTLIGALLAQGMAAHSVAGRRLRRLRDRLFLPGRLVNLGLMVLGLWALSQLMPLVPSLDRGTLVQGIRPLLAFLRGPAEFHGVQALGYALNIAAAGAIAATLVRRGRRFLPLFAAVIAVVLALKVPVVGRQLSAEALVGAAGGLLLLAVLVPLREPLRLTAGGVMLLLAYALAQMQGVPNPHAPLLVMNWTPFRGQLEGRAGLEDIAATLWPFAALAYLVVLSTVHRSRTVIAAGALLVFGFAFALEWLQAEVPGRYPDITDACLAALGWWLPWLYPVSRNAEITAAMPPPYRRLTQLTAVWLTAAFLALAVLVTGLDPSATGEYLDENQLPRLPAAGELAPLKPATFHDQHPRLPAPSDTDLARLRAENPDYLSQKERRARQGHLEAAVIFAYADPDADLTPLYRRLVALKFSGRGHDQTKPLAVAYDWLYPRWNETRRAQLRAKLSEACDYEIAFIRQARLSPYNVYLYNSPFQALMACAIALYHDDPRGDAIMSFTIDYWKNRILPVWRQIMGKNGGWHEGGEYLGIGIGQAVYQLPAMWRKATGEDLFATEPGLRGFLNFVVYRTRPDGSDFRWGDGAFFRRYIPDLLPLAMEYGDRAAYGLRPSPPRPVPSSWPWGPLTDNRLYDPDAVKQRPLTAHFDGIGQIVARSDWTKDATYVSFKAGDNYWSHSHLDQGAFTLYKGGALAIDSGLYGPRYDADHHMNYQYQTIAHNTVTVTDPADTVPAPPHGDRPARPIANDGGQRRVGSGWGVEAAPLDIDEWRRKRDIYHTGKIEQLLMEDGLTVAVADITPAYTNRRSGEGPFSDRTRRVEDFHRIFGYDRDDDVIVVFDHVVAANPQFSKRWLLHTLDKPATTAEGFVVETPARDAPGHAGGRLVGKVLLPRQAAIHLVGGEGHEFWVDGKNYDEETADVLRRRRHAEPGQWRIELSPSKAEREDNFLVVMLPSLLKEQAPAHRVRLLEGLPKDQVGVEVRGPRHTSRWYFDHHARRLRVEVKDANGTRRYDVGDQRS